MLRPLPSEILDLIVGHLHNEPATLKTCCLVSKSWVPRTRRHLFDTVEFGSPSPTIISWMNAFPDPLDSPAHYVQTLKILDIWSATAPAHWIRAFRNVVRLNMAAIPWEDLDDEEASLVPFHGLSHTVRFLRLGFDTAPLPEVFDLICSFPLLEDLVLCHLAGECDPDEWETPSTSPKFTGTFNLVAMRGAGSTVRWLLGLPNGLHFKNVALVCVHEADFGPTTDLVSACSESLEDLNVTCNFMGLCPLPQFSTGNSLFRPDPPPSSFSLSAATKLKELTFQCVRRGVGWITTALQTNQSKNLQRIAISLCETALDDMTDMATQEWMDLDHLLVQFWGSHSIRPRVAYVTDEEGLDMEDYSMVLLPELTRRGLIDLVKITS